MSVKDLIAAAQALFTALIARSLAFTLTVLVPRDRRLWLVIGREHGQFVDNAKHFFCYSHISKVGGRRVQFLTEDRTLASRLCTLGTSAVHYPSIIGFWTLLRAGSVIVDSMDYTEHGRIGFLRGAQIVQIWHGVPLKQIELALHRRRLARLPPIKRRLLQAFMSVTGRFREVDILVSPSRFITQRAFADCFSARRICDTGYPRNDALLDPETLDHPLTMINVDSDVMHRMNSHRASGGKVVVYAPTFRKDRHSPFEEGHLDLETLSTFCEEHGLLFVLKLHPLLQGLHSTASSHSVIEIEANSDIYPLLRFADVLITDYSSIFFDFLLLDRAVIFYPYDLLSYMSDDRPLFFEYSSMTPGPKASDFDSLLGELRKVADNGADNWRTERERVVSLAFNHRDRHSTERIWHAMRRE